MKKAFFLSRVLGGLSVVFALASAFQQGKEISYLRFRLPRLV